ncbi:TRAP transporter permease [Halomonas sp. NPDC076908]|uniref:TRAP transporter permease n=1 Tax=Halomonas sp. NPDC076908 TaxID=3390567 RepID=UPI003D07BF29
MAILYSGVTGLVKLLLPLLSILWVFAVPERLGIPLVSQQLIAIMLGLAAAGAFLTKPYRDHGGIIDFTLALLVAASWFWYAWNFEQWMVMLAFRTPDMWVPGIVALLLLLEALRKSLGLVIATFIASIVAYGFVGHLLPGSLSAETSAPTRTVLYLYADSSGVPGTVVRIIIELVVPFVIFGKLMEIAGGMTFFNNLAMSLMGHRRGGPAKVAVVASSSFGTLSGSTVANIMSTGIMTIPLMKRTGFSPSHASAIEAVASNGAQLMPPVMGATAFIMAEFLDVSYGTIVTAAIIPALLYYLVLFMQIDAIAVRDNIRGLDKSELPNMRETLRQGWIFIFPLAVLIYLMFWQGFNPGIAALYAAGVVLIGYLARYYKEFNLFKFISELRSVGTEAIPLILIGGAAGAVVGIMNSTGFAFQLSLLLSNVAEQYGLFSMLLLTALVSIVLGMGMPTAAVYIVLITVIAPTVIDLGIEPIAAHMFLFYFGLMSMITPPIAIGSIVAASIGRASMWSTGFYGMKLGIMAYMLPFLWIYNPAILMNGSLIDVFLVVMHCVVGAVLIRESILHSPVRWLPDLCWSSLLMLLALGIGSASLWMNDNAMLMLSPIIIPILIWGKRISTSSMNSSNSALTK